MSAHTKIRGSLRTGKIESPVSSKFHEQIMKIGSELRVR